LSGGIPITYQEIQEGIGGRASPDYDTRSLIEVKPQAFMGSSGTSSYWITPLGRKNPEKILHSELLCRIFGSIPRNNPALVFPQEDKLPFSPGQLYPIRLIRQFGIQPYP
jgi:hypothetical protein